METQTKPRFSIGYYFLCSGVVVTLVVSVVSFLNLVFETLNKRFPDVLNSTYQYGYSTYEYEGIRMALAMLIIIFPIFLVLSYVWNKFIDGELGRWDIVVRKWMVYSILFLSGIVVIADLITLVKYFISGEISARFVYKILAVLLVAVLVGLYYGSLARNKENVNSKIGVIVGGLGIILAIAAISYSFMIIGSPTKQRSLRLDDRRVGDLQSIQYQVINFWQQKEKLPANLTELADPISGWSMPVEPEFEKGKTYEYKVIAPLQFELCATFSEAIPKGWRESSYGGGIPPMMPYYSKEDVAVSSYPYPSGGTNESWSHDAGRTCFLRTIDKDMYPPFPKPAPFRAL